MTRQARICQSGGDGPTITARNRDRTMDLDEIGYLGVRDLGAL